MDFWVDIDDTYQVCPEGFIRNRITGFVLKNTPNGNGYARVKLHKQTKNVHIIVARTFIKNPTNLPVVNHQDGNKMNCHVDNLEWTTSSGNQQHAYDTGLRDATQRGENHGNTELLETQVRKAKVLMKQGFTLTETSMATGIARTTLKHISCGQTWNHVNV